VYLASQRVKRPSLTDAMHANGHNAFWHPLLHYRKPLPLAMQTVRQSLFTWTAGQGSHTTNALKQLEEFSIGDSLCFADLRAHSDAHLFVYCQPIQYSSPIITLIYGGSDRQDIITLLHVSSLSDLFYGHNGKPRLRQLVA